MAAAIGQSPRIRRPAAPSLAVRIDSRGNPGGPDQEGTEAAGDARAGRRARRRAYHRDAGVRTAGRRRLPGVESRRGNVRRRHGARSDPVGRGAAGADAANASFALHAIAQRADGAEPARCIVAASRSVYARDSGCPPLSACALATAVDARRPQPGRKHLGLWGDAWVARAAPRAGRLSGTGARRPLRCRPDHHHPGRPPGDRPVHPGDLQSGRHGVDRGPVVLGRATCS